MFASRLGGRAVSAPAGRIVAFGAADEISYSLPLSSSSLDEGEEEV
jgi:hypothetical protein